MNLVTKERCELLKELFDKLQMLIEPIYKLLSNSTGTAGLWLEDN